MVGRHGLPVEAVGVQDVEAEVGGALEGHALGLGGLVAEADGDAVVVPLCPNLVALAPVAAGALLALLRGHPGLDHLGEQGHVHRRTGPGALDHPDVVAVSRQETRYDPICNRLVSQSCLILSKSSHVYSVIKTPVYRRMAHLWTA